MFICPWLQTTEAQKLLTTIWLKQANNLNWRKDFNVFLQKILCGLELTKEDQFQLNNLHAQIDNLYNLLLPDSSPLINVCVPQYLTALITLTKMFNLKHIVSDENAVIYGCMDKIGTKILALYPESQYNSMAVQNSVFSYITAICDACEMCLNHLTDYHEPDPRVLCIPSLIMQLMPLIV